MERAGENPDVLAIVVELPFRCQRRGDSYREAAGNIIQNRVAGCCGQTIELRGETWRATVQALAEALTRDNPE